MSVFPNDPILGKLRIQSVYGYFDGPYLFSVSNEVGQVFLAQAIPDNNRGRGFLYVPISRERLWGLESGSVSVFSCLARPETEIVFEYRPATSELTRHKASEIPPDFLPDEDAKLPNRHTAIEARRELELSPELTLSAAEAGGIEIIKLALVFPNLGPFQAPLGQLGTILSNFQDAINALGQKFSGVYTDRGRISETLLEKLDLRITRAFASSFGVEIIAPSRDNLLEQSLASRSLDWFVRFLHSVTEVEQADILRDLNKRSVSKVVDFLESLVDGDVMLEGVYASSYLSRKARLTTSLENIQRALQVASRIEQEESDRFELECILIALHSRRRTFEVEPAAGGTRINGRIAFDAPDHVVHSTIMSRYKARLSEVVETSSITGDEVHKYTLLDLEAR